MSLEPSSFNKWMYLVTLAALVVLGLDLVVWRP